MASWRFAAIALLGGWLAACDGVASDPSGTGAPPAPPPPAGPVAAPGPSAPGPAATTPPPAAPAITSFSCEAAAGGPAGAELCHWAITAALPVSCTLTTNGGAPETVPDCVAAPSLARTFAPGSYTLQLSVSDTGGRSAVAAFVVEVAAPHVNRAPQITAFTASPATGIIPLLTTFSWKISDPDGDRLSCGLDIGGDGAFDYVLPDCTSATVQAHTFASAGPVDVTLTVSDPGALSASMTFRVTANPPVVLAGDVRANRAEWGQSVIAANPTLVSGKPALLRVYALADRQNISGVVVKAEGFRAGASLGQVTLTGPATPPTTESVSDLSKQYRGTIPAAWIATGLEVRVTVDPANVVAETDETNNTLVLTPTIGKATVLPVTAVPVVHQGVIASTPNIEATMLQVWPLKSVSTQVRAPYTFSGTLYATSTSAWSQLLSEILSLRTADGSHRYYYGFVHVGYSSGVAGIGYVGEMAATGMDDSLSTAAHELGHNMGRNHAPCGGASGPDPSYPYAGAKIGSWGYDATANQLVNPASNYDLMAYCDPTWVSDYNYKAVQSYLSANPPQMNIVPLPPQTDYVMVSGTVTGNSVEVRPLQRVLAAPAPAREGPYTLRLFAGGKQLDVPFGTAEVADVADEEEQFSLLVPYPGAVSALEVLRGGRVLFHRDAVATPAGHDAVKLVDLGDELVLTWDAKAYPNASVAHLGDNERTTLAWFLEGGAAVVRTDGLAAGGSFEVSLSDGLNPVRSVVSR